MAEMGTGGASEQLLDQQLAGSTPAPPAPPRRNQPISGGAVASIGAPEDGAISVKQLRMEFIKSIQAGMEVSQDICDESGVLLLAAGSRINARFLELLQQRGITRVRMVTPERAAEPEVAPELEVDDGLHSPLSRALDERLAGELQQEVIYRPVPTWRRPRLSIDDLKEHAFRCVEKHQTTGLVVSDLCDALKCGRQVTATTLRHAVTEFVSMAAIDFDLLPLIVALQHSFDEYLFDHCVNVSLLSMALAAHLGLSRETVMVIGLGGMLHDIGMLRVPESIRLASRALTEREWEEIHRHPLHTLDMLADLRGIPKAVRFIGYQVHERNNGLGYPRGREGRQIHEFAKIVAIADVYSAMTHERPYRPAMNPYVAAKSILLDAGADRFDRQLVRAFLDTVSIFPTGSRVELSNGTEARVLRVNPGLHTRPVVETLAADGTPTGQIIDLSEEGTPRVTRVP